MATKPLTRKVTFKKFSAKALRSELAGQEPPYPVYFFGKRVFFERPETPGTTYRRYRNFP